MRAWSRLTAARVAGHKRSSNLSPAMFTEIAESQVTVGAEAPREPGDNRGYRAAIVGAPSYFRSHPKPKTPHDLLKHRCINFRHGTAGVYRWEFDKGKKSLSVAVNGPLIVDDVETLVRAAIDGVGLAFVSDERVTAHLANGELIRVLEDWCQPFPGFFFYYPSRRQQPASLSALIKTLRW